MTVINIKYVNPAKEGKKFGSLKSVEGETYWVPAGMVSGFRAGTSVDVPVEVQKWGANMVNVVSGAARTSTEQAPWQKPQPQQPAQNAQPPATSGHSDNTAGMIFVTGVVGRAMGSGQFASGDISHLTHEALKAWFLLKEQLG